MSEIFVSYAREDLDRVEGLATHLEEAGWSVWWDRRVKAGEPFDAVIAREVEAARVVLVLWSRHSVSSAWVKAEATEAQRQNKLVPVLLEPVQLPMPFGVFHTADLSGWDGSQANPDLLTLLRSLLERLAGGASPRQEGVSERPREVTGWHAVLIAKEATRQAFLLRIGTRQHELECVFRPNYLWNRFVVRVDGREVSKGGHQYRDQISLDFPLGDDWMGQVQLSSGTSNGELLGRCDVSIGGQRLYLQPGSACPNCQGTGEVELDLPVVARRCITCLACRGVGRVFP